MFPFIIFGFIVVLKTNVFFSLINNIAILHTQLVCCCIQHVTLIVLYLPAQFNCYMDIFYRFQ